MRKYIVLLLLLSLNALHAQQEEAWVYFTDKPNVQSSIENPLSILSQRAIDRKAQHNIPIDVRDVPVDESYITSLKNQFGITYKAKSKWMNCAYVVGNQQDIESLSTLAFVDHLRFADDNLNAKPLTDLDTQEAYDKFEVEESFTYGNTSNQVTMINAQVLHENNFTGQGMLIAVMDSGFPNVNTITGFQHLRDNNGLLGGYDFVDRTDDYAAPSLFYHGTRVLSEMAGFVQDEFVGTAPDADYYLFRTEDAAIESPVEESYWVEAAERADSLGVDVINTSLGYSLYDNPAYSYDTTDMDGNTAFITKGANIATEKGVLVVVAAGNSAQNPVFPIISAPADGDVFTIGAVTANETHAGFSSIGPTADGRVKPDVAVQGKHNAIVTEDDMISFGNGTSYASPTLAGAIACLWQANLDKTNLEIMQLVRESASLYQNPTDELGYGIPDFQVALSNFLSTRKEHSTPSLVVYPNPTNGKLQVKLKKLQRVDLKVFSITGELLLQQKNIQSNIDLSELAPGVYLGQFNDKNFKQTQKIIIL